MFKKIFLGQTFRIKVFKIKNVLKKQKCVTENKLKRKKLLKKQMFK